MPTALLVFYLLTAPADKIVCQLWMNAVPTSADVAAACGDVDLSDYALEARNLRTGESACRLPDAALLYQITEACRLSGRLDNYRLDIIQPHYVELLCAVDTEHPQPTRADVSEQCGATIAAQLDALDVRYVGEKQPPSEQQVIVCQLPPLARGAGLLQQPREAAELATSEMYHLLSGKLLWYGYAKPTQCPNGLSGVDMRTGAATACGLASAETAAIAWQNRLDGSIYSAAVDYNVPARLLKQLIARETQFWPWTGTNGEAGLIQLSDDGADVTLRWFLDGYHRLRPDERAAQRSAYLAQLRCDYCDIERAMRHAAEKMPQYAQALAAYRCQYGSWQDALVAWNERHANWIGG